VWDERPSPVEGPPAQILGDHDPGFLSRVEDAGLNASAPPQQRWMDGWLVRTHPGKAQRARCVNAVAEGRRPIADKLAECRALYRALGLPVIVRITPFTRPADLDGTLCEAGYAYHDDTRVMVLPDLAAAALDAAPLADGLRWTEAAPAAYAEAVGGLRGSTPAARRAHAERLAASPVPYRGFTLTHDGQLVACGQYAQEGDLAGLYDIATTPGQQRRGYGEWVCKQLLAIARSQTGARAAYLQVGADNDVARRLYRRLAFRDGYSYHYRTPAPAR
jgi:ribosomal protein S18 acetylase RimI-like enzyme